MRFRKVYLEIGNVCDLRCSFCPGTRRAPHFLTVGEFSLLTERLRGWTDYLYFHLMGEPLLHPDLATLLRVAGEKGFYVNITTNGILLPTAAECLLSSPALHRVNLSLQAWEANDMPLSLFDYVNQCADFAKRGADRGLIVSLRLWNGGGADKRNGEILSLLGKVFPEPWQAGQKNTVLAPRVYLERGERFDWPGPDAAETGTVFCLGLRDQIGVLCDGTVVPCCLDAEGALALGNLYETSLEEILSGPRARAIYDGFSRREATEELCRRCGYAARFS